jgi:hypothetical protein
MWNQLEQDNDFKEKVISQYFHAFHRMMGLPGTDEFLKAVLLSKAIDLKFEESYLVFVDTKDGKEIERIYANC